LTEIEKDNPSLENVLPKRFSASTISNDALKDLIELFDTISAGRKDDVAKDSFGRIYEFFMKKFSKKEGQKGGEFFTPESIVRLLVEILEPYEGIIYDPTCGSGGMFVQSQKFLDAHQNENGKNTHLENVLIFGRTISRKQNSIPENETIYAGFSLQRSLQTQVEKIPELDTRSENGRKTIHFHGFRKYFRTTVGNVCGRDFAEAMIGHGFYMDTYYILSEEQKRELYLKAEPLLTISDFKLVEQNLTDLTTKYIDLESKFNQLRQYLRFHSITIPSSETRN